MGMKARSGFFKGTRGNPVAGDAVFKSHPTDYFDYISRRKDRDQNGVFDVVAHGSDTVIQVTHDSKPIVINSRVLAKLIRANPNYKKGQSIRLISCSTGSMKNGFAQNLANKLNVVVEAPTKLVWAYADGKYVVASRSKSDPNMPNLKDKGRFVKFYPGGNKK